jgi:hypothetical protein
VRRRKLNPNRKKYYASMLNALYGLQDDFDANMVPDEAKDMLLEIIEICKSDFNFQFGDDKK